MESMLRCNCIVSAVREDRVQIAEYKLQMCNISL